MLLTDFSDFGIGVAWSSVFVSDMYSDKNEPANVIAVITMILKTDFITEISQIKDFIPVSLITDNNDIQLQSQIIDESNFISLMLTGRAKSVQDKKIVDNFIFALAQAEERLDKMRVKAEQSNVQKIIKFSNAR